MGPRGVGNPQHSSLPPPRPPDQSQFKLKLQVHKEEVSTRFSEFRQSMTALAAEQEEFRRELREELRQLRLSYSNPPMTTVSTSPSSLITGNPSSPNYCQLPKPPPIPNCEPQPQIPDPTSLASFTLTQAVTNPTHTHIIIATTPPQILPQIHHSPNVKLPKMKFKFGRVHRKVRIQSLVTLKRTLSNLPRPMGTHGRSNKSRKEASSSSSKSRCRRKLDNSESDSYTGSGNSDNPNSSPMRSSGKRKEQSSHIKNSRRKDSDDESYESDESEERDLKKKRSSRNVNKEQIAENLASGDSKSTWVNHRVKYPLCKSQKQFLGRYYHRDYGPITFVSEICVLKKCGSVSNIILCFAVGYEWSRGGTKLNLKHKCANQDYNEAFETTLRVIYDKTFEENGKSMSFVLIQFDKKDFDCLWGLLVRGFKRTEGMNPTKEKLVLHGCSVLSAIDYNVSALSHLVFMSNRRFKVVMLMFSKPGEHFVATVLLNKMERESNIIAALAFHVKDSSGYIKNGEFERSFNEFGCICEEWVKEVYQGTFDNYLNTLKGSVGFDMVPIFGNEDKAGGLHTGLHIIVPYSIYWNDPMLEEHGKGMRPYYLHCVSNSVVIRSGMFKFLHNWVLSLWSMFTDNGTLHQFLEYNTLALSALEKLYESLFMEGAGNLMIPRAQKLLQALFQGMMLCKSLDQDKIILLSLMSANSCLEARRTISTCSLVISNGASEVILTSRDSLGEEDSNHAWLYFILKFGVLLGQVVYSSQMKPEHEHVIGSNKNQFFNPNYGVKWVRVVYICNQLSSSPIEVIGFLIIVLELSHWRYYNIITWFLLLNLCTWLRQSLQIIIHNETTSTTLLRFLVVNSDSLPEQCHNYFGVTCDLEGMIDWKWWPRYEVVFGIGQVTFAKCRAGLLKNTHEFSIRCDVQISLVIFSSTGKMFQNYSDSIRSLKIIQGNFSLEALRVYNSNSGKVPTDNSYLFWPMVLVTKLALEERALPIALQTNEQLTRTIIMVMSAVVHEVDYQLQDNDTFLALLKQNLHKVQERMKLFPDTRHTERTFEVGDWVYLPLQSYKQKAVEKRTVTKLSAKFYGPFEMVERMGTVAYKLKLPASARIHPAKLKLEDKLFFKAGRVVRDQNYWTNTD